MFSIGCFGIHNRRKIRRKGRKGKPGELIFFFENLWTMPQENREK
jgi:hypothetical protein